jgi:hypothetical protein
MEKVFLASTVILTVVLAALAVKVDGVTQRINATQPIKQQSHPLENVEIVSVEIKGSACEYYMIHRNKQLVTFIHKGGCTNCPTKTFTVDSGWEAQLPPLRLKSK